MATYTVVEKPRTGSWNIKAARKYKRSYLVVSSLINDTVDNVTSPIVTGASLPVRGDVYPTDAGAILTDIEAQQQANFFDWIVTYSYDSAIDFKYGTQGQSPSNQPENPLLRKPIITYGSRQETVYMPQDVAGNWVLNTAIDPFPDGIGIPVDIATIEIEINKSVAVGASIATLAMRVNSDAWTFNGVTYDAKRLRANSPKITSGFENNIPFWRWTWHIEVAPVCQPYNGYWDPVSVISQGFQYIDLAGKVKAFLDDRGLPCSKPRLLDAGGNKTTTPYFQSFHFYQTGAFTGVVP